MSLLGGYGSPAAVNGCLFGQVALIRFLLPLRRPYEVIVGWKWVHVESELAIHQFVLVSSVVLLEPGLKF